MIGKTISNAESHREHVMMPSAQKAHPALSEYALAIRGFKRQFARLSLDAQDLSSGQSGAFPRIVNAHVLRMLPLNEEFDTLFSDILTTRMLLPDLASHCARFVGLKPVSGDDSRYWQLPASTLSLSSPKPIDPVATIREAGAVFVRPCSNLSLDCGHVLCCVDGAFAIDGRPASEDAVSQLLDAMPDDTALIEWGSAHGADVPFEALIVKIYGFKDSFDTTRTHMMGVFDMASERGVELHGGSIRSNVDIAPDLLDDARRVVEMIIEDFPELEYACGWFAITEQGLALVQVDTGLDVAFQENPALEVLSHFERVVQGNRPTTLAASAKACVKELTEVHANRKGFVGFMYRDWIRGILEDYRSVDTPLSEKLWAHRRGFYSYRIEQYGLTDANASEFLSDIDYKRLRPLNGPYRKWLWDKVSAFLVMRPFAQYMPEHYCRIAGNGSSRVVQFGQSGIDSIPAIIALLEHKGMLAVKRAIGSHGTGFYKLEYRGVFDEYYVDGKACNANALAALLESLHDEYIVTEFVIMHPFLSSLYDEVVSTVRIMAIRTEEGFGLYDAFLRIGTSSTGNTDNLATGGVVAKVDLETGELFDPERLSNHKFMPCPHHPDTGTEIAGIIPFWDEIKRQVECMSTYLFPLEFFGFDVAVTAEGFKILEINVHQDLHRYVNYPESVKSYLSGKLDAQLG